MPSAPVVLVLTKTAFSLLPFSVVSPDSLYHVVGKALL